MSKSRIKHKYGLLWLVFCLCIVSYLERHPELVSGSHSPQILKQAQDNVYEKGFLERLDAEGHAIEKHVGRSDAYLFKRIQTEDISAASTFNTMAEAEDAIRTVLIKRGDLVAAWLQTERSNKKAFYHKIDSPVGRILKRGWNKPRVGNHARIVLIRDQDYPEGFYILTAYPEIK